MSVLWYSNDKIALYTPDSTTVLSKNAAGESHYLSVIRRKTSKSCFSSNSFYHATCNNYSKVGKRSFWIFYAESAKSDSRTVSYTSK